MFSDHIELVFKLSGGKVHKHPIFESQTINYPRRNEKKLEFLNGR